MEFKQCPNCGLVYNDGSYYCMKCNVRLKPAKEVDHVKHPELSDVEDRIIGTVSAGGNSPKCPTCGSTNVQPIGTGEKVISGVHQGSKKQIVKILVSFFGRGFFYGTEGCPVFPGEKNPGGLWTGQGEGIFAESLKLFDVSWVFSAGVTEHLRSGFAVNVAEIVFI